MTSPTKQIAKRKRRQDDRRRAPNKDERIAACLLMLKLGDEWLVPEPIRSTGTTAEILACVQWDHAFLHALGGDTRPQNITPMRVAAHKEKSKKDNGVAAKSKSLAKKEAAHRDRIAGIEPEIGDRDGDITRVTYADLRAAGAKIKSRGFPSKEERKALKKRMEGNAKLTAQLEEAREIIGGRK